MQLCDDKNVKVEPPLSSFVNIEDIPCVDVEFAFTKQCETGTANGISLLDTPGLGEYGADTRLRRILQQQLARASAILAVVDVNSIKVTEAERVRRAIGEVAKGVEDRLYIVVNKIDRICDRDFGFQKLADNIL